MSKASPFSTVKLADVVDILDSLRIPINGAERMGRAGTVPYYGANGFQGWIDRPLFNEPLILLAEDGGNFDDFATRPIAYRIDGPAWVNNHAHIIRAKAGVNQSFIFWSIVNKDIRKYIAGGTRTKLTQGELRRIEINLPIEVEQKGIAAILDTLDTAIFETEAIIAKLKAVKQGLLHDLLTRGIDANGELRPPQAEAPHLYKESTLGWIPKEWDFAPLVSKIDFPEGQVDPRRAPYCDWVLIAPDHIESGTGRLISTATAVEQQAISGKYVFQAGDVIYSKIRPYLRKAVLASNSGLCSADMYPLRPKTGIDSRYLLAVILGDQYSRFAESVSMRSGFPKINRNEMTEFSIGWPSSEEQSWIARILNDADIKQRTEEDDLEKLRLLKAGLMDDLLTGRVRVTPLLNTNNEQGAC